MLRHAAVERKVVSIAARLACPGKSAGGVAAGEEKHTSPECIHWIFVGLAAGACERSPERPRRKRLCAETVTYATDF
jgi:hypothetical protein